jgi:hypothetical protein
MFKCTAAWVSVENTLTVEMPVSGKRKKAMKLLPFPPPLEIAAAISHIPTASTTTGFDCF